MRSWLDHVYGFQVCRRKLGFQGRWRKTTTATATLKVKIGLYRSDEEDHGFYIMPRKEVFTCNSLLSLTNYWPTLTLSIVLFPLTKIKHIMKLDPEVYNVSGEANVSTLLLLDSAGLDCLELIGLKRRFGKVMDLLIDSRHNRLM